MSACILLVSAFVVLASGRQFKSKEETLEIIQSLLSSPQPLARYSGGNPLLFKWSDCGNKDSTLILRNLTLSPDPVVVPGNVSVAVNVTLKEKLNSPLEVSIKLKKLIFGIKIEIPCDNGFGSCTYKDVCSMVKNLKCPHEFIDHHIPCKCPFSPGNYSLPETSIPISLPSNIPSSIADGDYDVEAHIYDSKGAQAGCLQLSLSLKLKS